MDKQKIVDGAKQYIKYITTNIPQVDDFGRVKYYFSGSLAMLALSDASFVKPMTFDKDGVFVEECVDIYVPVKNKKMLLNAVRPLGVDIDIVTTDDDYLKDKGGIYTLSEVRKNCDLATDLCPAWARGGGTMYFDNLSDERQFNRHDVAEVVMSDGQEVLIADPLNLIIHKFADSISCLGTIKRIQANEKFKETSDKEKMIGRMEVKYRKDISDFVSMFNGIVGLYKIKDFDAVVRRSLDGCSDSALNSALCPEQEVNILKFNFDAGKKIEPKYQPLFDKFIKSALRQSTAVM